MLLVELNRMASHLLFQATNGMDLGAISMMIYGWREREETLRLLETITGLRMNHNFIRPGGVAADLPDGWEEETLDGLRGSSSAACASTTSCSPRTRSGWSAWSASARSPPSRRSPSAPAARSCARPASRGTCARPSRTSPTTRSTSTSIYTENGDCFDRYRIRLYEMLESIRIVKQCIEKMPPGDYRVQDRKVTPPPRARIDESMEALIHHFKLFTEGFKVPPGETYVAVESPRGEIGCYLVVRRHRQAVPPAHPRPVLLQPPVGGPDGGGEHGRRRGRDRVQRRPDHGRGRPVTCAVHARREPAPRRRTREIVGRYPRAEVGDPAAGAPRPGPGRLAEPGGDGRDRRPRRRDAGRGAGHVLLLHDVQARAGRAPGRVGVHERELSRHRRPRGAARISRSATPTTTTSTSRRSSASPPATARRRSR